MSDKLQQVKAEAIKQSELFSKLTRNKISQHLLGDVQILTEHTEKIKDLLDADPAQMTIHEQWSHYKATAEVVNASIKKIKNDVSKLKPNVKSMQKMITLLQNNVAILEREPSSVTRDTLIKEIKMLAARVSVSLAIRQKVIETANETTVKLSQLLNKMRQRELNTFRQMKKQTDMADRNLRRLKKEKVRS